MSGRGVRAIILLAILAGVVVSGWLFFRPRPVDVVVVTVERGRVEATVSNTRAGTVKACRRALLAPQASGQVKRIPVREGERVQAGQVLIEIWNDDLQGQLRLTRREAEAAEAKAEEACLAAELSEREASRYERLFASGVIGESALDRARAEKDRTGAGCTAARAVVGETKQRIGVAAAMLDRTFVKAPFAGVVAEINAEAGEIVTPSPPGIPTPPAIDLIDDTCLYVVAPIDEVDAPRVRVGLPARVGLDAFPDRTFEGRVSRVAPFVFDREKQSRTVDVEVQLDDPDALNQLLPGYSADVEVLLEAREDVVRIPSETIVEGHLVLVVEGGTLVERDVRLGLTNWDFSEVLEGLDEDDLVVVSLDREGVKPGAAVRLEADREADR